MDNNLEKINIFFLNNMKIKNIMYNMAFKDEYAYSKDSIIEYEDSIFKNLSMLERLLYEIIVLFNHSEKDLDNLEQRFKKYRQDFIKVQGNVEELKEVYKNNISNMDPEFIKSVNESCIGYYLYRGSNIKTATSVNEYLHYWHAMIVNNEQTYQRMPELLSKGNENNSVHLYGNSDQIAEKIYINMPSVSSRVDILSLKDRILIMMRDLGHALMIEITYKGDNAIVNYFIPKICNYDMVLKLKGISNVKKDNKFAKGTFEISKEELITTLNDLIVKIPTDNDMFIEGGICYREKNR